MADLTREQLEDGIREDGTVAGEYIETWYAPLEAILSDERGFLRIQGDDGNGGMLVEIRVPFAVLERNGWARPPSPTESHE